MDRPVSPQNVHPPGVFGGERDVRPFALPGMDGGEDPGDRGGPQPRLLVRPVADGGEVLGAVVGPVLHGPEVAEVVPAAAGLTPVQAVTHPTVADFPVPRRGWDAVQ